MDLSQLQFFETIGAKFCKVLPKDKKPFEDGWQNKPYCLADVRAHVENGGNIGVLGGYGGIGFLDLDGCWKRFEEEYPILAGRTAIIRENAPERGKLIIKINGEMPPSQKYLKAKVEWIAKGGQAVVYGTHPSGSPYTMAGDGLAVFEFDELLGIIQKLVGDEFNAQPPAVSVPDEIPEGARDEILFKLACSMRKKGFDQPAILAAISETNRTRCKPPLSDDQIKKLVKSASQYERGEVMPDIPPEPEFPQDLPLEPPIDPDAQALLEYFDHPGATKKDGAQPPAIDPAHYSTWADLEKIIGPIEFIWKPWLARGIVSALVSTAGEGKSLLLLHVCGCFIEGWDFPDGTPFTDETGKVLWVEAESAQQINLERAVNWGLPRDCFISALGDPSQDVNLDNPNHRDLVKLRASLPEVKFIAIDSLKGSSRQDDKEQKIAEIVHWFSGLLRDVNKPGIITHHLNKPRMFDSDQLTLDRVRGSSAIVQFTRIVWALSAPNSAQAEHKKIEQLKNNLARFPKPIGMIMQEGKRLEFNEPPKLPKNETQFDKACELIKSQLAKGPEPADDMFDAGRACGISDRTMNAAKKELRIVPIKKGREWYWGLPAEILP